MVTPHIQEICTMCFLLNGRKRNESTEYSCGFFPRKIHTMAHGKPGKPGIDIEFNGVYIGYGNRIRVMFNNKSMWITEDGKAFIDQDSKANAQSIFGKNANPNIVVIEAKWAMAEILQDFKKEIDDALNKRGKYAVFPATKISSGTIVD